MKINEQEKNELVACISEKVSEGYEHDEAVAMCVSMIEESESDKALTKEANEAGVITKEFSIDTKNVDKENMTVSGYASTWDIDQVDDVIREGAFAKTIRERGDKIKLLWQHCEPIGQVVELEETAKGLFVKCKISDIQLGRDAIKLVEDGVIDSFSIGFCIPRGKAEIGDDGIRYIYEIKLYEVSLVTFPCNENATTLTSEKEYEYNSGNDEDGKGLIQDGAESIEKEFEDSQLDELKDCFEEISDFARLRLY